MPWKIILMLLVSTQFQVANAAKQLIYLPDPEAFYILGEQLPTPPGVLHATGSEPLEQSLASSVESLLGDNRKRSQVLKLFSNGSYTFAFHRRFRMPASYDVFSVFNRFGDQSEFTRATLQTIL